MEQQIRFCTTCDGVRIAYVDAGEGPPLVVAPCWTMSLGDWSRPHAKGFWEELARGRRMVTFDCRGVGASQRAVSDVSLEAVIADLTAVVDHLGLQRFDLCGFLAGTVACMAYASRHPQRVSRLVLWNAYPFGKEWMKPEAVDALVQLMYSNWELATRTIAEFIYPSGPLEAQQWATAALRQSLSPETAVKYVQFRSSVDVRPYLPQVQAPTLVLQRLAASDVPFVRETQVRAAAALLPNARLVTQEGDSCPYNKSDYLHGVREFLAEGTLSDALPYGLTTREAEVLRLIAAGRSNREIARELVISTNTVDRHVSNILSKTGAANRAEAASCATRHGLVS